MVEANSKAVVDLVSHGFHQTHPYGDLINKINDWRTKQWELEFKHIFKEENRVADHLANLALKQDVGMMILQQPRLSRSLARYNPTILLLVVNLDPMWDRGSFLSWDRVDHLQNHKILGSCDFARSNQEKNLRKITFDAAKP